MKKHYVFLFSLSYFITSAQITTAPGGITSNLKIWVKSDAGIATTTEGAAVSTWNSNDPTGIVGVANEGIVGYYADPGIGTRPIYRSANNINNFNFNPAVEIVSNDIYRAGYKFTSGFPDDKTNALTSYTLLTRAAASTYRTVFVMNGVTRSSNTSSIAGVSQSPFFGTVGNYANLYNEKEGGGANYGYKTINSIGTNVPSIQSYYNKAVGGSMKYFFDNNAIAFGEPTDLPNSTYNYPGMVLLMDNDAGSGSTSQKGDQVGEFILYSEEQTPTERQKINSYLGIKYGITLGETANPVNYLISSSTSTDTDVVWAGDKIYQNNVFGIGRDDKSALHQRISNSIDVNGKGILVLSTDEKFTEANISHAAIPTNMQFTMIGDNGGSVLFSDVLTISGKSLTRMKRVWKAQDTGAMECMNIRFRTNKANNIIVAPAAGKDLYLITADDEKFTTNTKMVKVNYNITAIDVLINFKSNSNNNFFTLAITNKAPIEDNTSAPISLGINTSSDNWIPKAPNTYLEIHSKNLGMVITRLTTLVRNAINQQKGMLVYDTDLGKFYVSNGTVWREINMADDKDFVGCINRN